MSRAHVLFWLHPESPAAYEVINDPENAYLIDRSHPSPCFAIGHFRSKCGRRETLVTIGRLGDIVLRSTTFSREQCSFEIDPTTNVIMFHDSSRVGTSNVHGRDSTPFRFGSPRKVVVQQGLNTYIGMGGQRRDIVVFRMQWPHASPETLKLVEARDVRALAVNPRFLRTDSGNTETEVPTKAQTRVHSARPERPMIRWAKIDALGAGAFGEVIRAVDVDTGRLVAVKTVKIRQDQHRDASFATLKREIETIGRIEHPFVVDWICSQASINSPEAHIVMELMKGSLYSLLGGQWLPVEQLNSVTNLVLTHMLQALDCLASEDIIHRDVKPENILYTHGPDGKPVFKLGDFGVCNHAAQAQTQSGTAIYMAPEFWSPQGQGQGERAQTTKADTWSLLVVLLWVYDFRGFRREAYGAGFNLSTVPQRAAEATAPGQRLHQLAPMARRDPGRRASAAQMMVLLDMFSQEPKAILCSHGKDPGKIPALSADETPPPVHVPVPVPAPVSSSSSRLAGRRSSGMRAGHALVQTMDLD
ncbi:hypothetical protein KVR01_010556 [Diaporthe batatas]|uniref:uncharacterized protein n=1 Tax=Diaporthe batatas TaxID=748121 RepID=UPI001D0506C5|nr:uncharacterized protein KVR01_010556 [Diaporthe batatas]KAG8159919.1 hypothetical protein KVR01_010556 [Diaporthe batatas]